jgi:hypothetical protein
MSYISSMRQSETYLEREVSDSAIILNPKL